MRFVDICSGIGGFALGLTRAGMTPEAFCEIDPFCRDVLRKHWPDVPIHPDLEKFDGHSYRRSARLICAGLPCQPYSKIGEQRGEDDDRALWPEFMRVIREGRFDWVFTENVADVVYMALDGMLADLESEGYRVWSFVVPACSLGAWHRRKRLFIVAHRQTPENTAPGSIADALGAGLERHGRDAIRVFEQRWYDSFQDRPITTRNIFDDGRRIGVPEPAISGISNGLPRPVDEIRALGNSVYVPLIEVFGRAIMQFEQYENSVH